MVLVAAPAIDDCADERRPTETPTRTTLHGGDDGDDGGDQPSDAGMLACES